MGSSLEDIEAQAKALAPEERAKLAESLLASLQGPPISEIEDAWAREVEQRLAAYDRGESPTYAAGDVFAEACHRSR